MKRHYFTFGILKNSPTVIQQFENVSKTLWRIKQLSSEDIA